MNTITNILVEWTKCFSQDLYNTVCPLWHWCSHNPTKSNCEYYYQTFLSYMWILLPDISKLYNT